MCINFEEPKTRIISDVVILFCLIIFSLFFIIYNLLLPNNTIIQCDNISKSCIIQYTNLLNYPTKFNTNIKFTYYDKIDIWYSDRTRYQKSNINILINNEEFHYHIIQPSVKDDEVRFILEKFNYFLNNKNIYFYYNCNNNVNTHTRLFYVLGILFYCILGSIFCILDAKHFYKK